METIVSYVYLRHDNCLSSTIIKIVIIVNFEVVEHIVCKYTILYCAHMFRYTSVTSIIYLQNRRPIHTIVLFTRWWSLVWWTYTRTHNPIRSRGAHGWPCVRQLPLAILSGGSWKRGPLKSCDRSTTRPPQWQHCLPFQNRLQKISTIHIRYNNKNNT